MLFPDTHLRFTSMMFPGANKKLIKEVNHQTDNPKLWQQYMSSMQQKRYKNNGFFKNPYDVFNLSQSASHRRTNHDALSGMMVGAMAARKMGLPPSMGIMSSFGHQIADQYSNLLVSKLGVEGRNIFEALWAMSGNKYKQKYNRRHSEQRWM